MITREYLGIVISPRTQNSRAFPRGVSRDSVRCRCRWCAYHSRVGQDDDEGESSRIEFRDQVTRGLKESRLKVSSSSSSGGGGSGSSSSTCITNANLLTKYIQRTMILSCHRHRRHLPLHPNRRAVLLEALAQQYPRIDFLPFQPPRPYF